MERGIEFRNYIKREAKHIIISSFGAILFAIGYRWFIVPGGLYSGGFTGISQLLNMLIHYILREAVSDEADLTGIIYWCMNIPLLAISLRQIGTAFFLRTIICVCIQSVAMSFIPVPDALIFSDPIINSILGGMVAGWGAGLSLRSGASGGGTDIIGMICSRNYPSFSVGKINIIFNAFIYIIAALRSDINIAAYSLLFSAVNSFVVDRTHIQNIKMVTLVISKSPYLGKIISGEIGRGVTRWKGTGEYSEREMYIYYIVTNKYEEYRLRRLIYKNDRNAFTAILSPDQILGNFDKRLEVP